MQHYKGYYLDWWKFSIKMILKDIKYSKGNLFSYCMPPSKLKEYKELFCRILPKLYLDIKNEILDNIIIRI